METTASTAQITDAIYTAAQELLKVPGVGYRIGTYTTLLHILRNPVYIGTWKTGDKAYPNNHEAIVSRQTWDSVHYLLDKRQEHIHPHPRNRNYDTLLKGLILRPDPKYIVSVSPHNGEISFAWKDNENRMHPNRRDSIPLATVETMFQEIFTRRVLRDNKCYQYAQAATSLYEAEAKNRKHIQETITGLEAQRRVLLDDLEDPIKRAKMSERTVEEKYKKVADREGEIARLQTVLDRPSNTFLYPILSVLSNSYGKTGIVYHPQILEMLRLSSVKASCLHLDLTIHGVLKSSGSYGRVIRVSSGLT